jgi:hypothetical protein
MKMTMPHPSETVYSRVLAESTQQPSTRQPLFRRLEELLGRPVVTLFASFVFPVSLEDNDVDILEGILRTLDLSGASPS